MTKTTIYYKYGVMNSGKSMDLLKIAYNYEENGIYPLILKPHIDSRVAEKIYSRVGLEKDAIEISAETDISKLITPNIEVILIDESQFLEPEVIDKIVYEAYNKNIKTLMFFGLKNDFRGLLFDGSKRIIEIADKIEESTSICWCGKKARQNARIINGEMSKNGDIIMIDNEKDIEYITLCNYHYFTNNIGKKKDKDEKID